MAAILPNRLDLPWRIRFYRTVPSIKAAVKYQAYSSAMPFSAKSFFAFSFLAKCIRPMPRSTLGALVN